MLVRQRSLLDSLDNNTFDQDVYMEKYGIREKTVLRDFKTLAEQGELFDHRVSILRKKCLGKLTQKTENDALADNLMVTIVLSGVTSKTEVYKDVNITKTEEVSINVNNFTPEELQFAKSLARKFIKANDTRGSSIIH